MISFVPVAATSVLRQFRHRFPGYDPSMSADCENARDELQRAEARLREEKAAELTASRARDAAAAAVETARSQRRLANDDAERFDTKVASCRAELQAARATLIDARTNYHELNREAHLNGLEEQERKHEWALTDAEESATRAHAELERSNNAVDEAISLLGRSVDDHHAAEAEVAKAETWVSQANGKVERACSGS